MFALHRYARRPSPSMVVALIALFVASGGVAYAAIPDTAGEIHGCYLNRTGALRVIDTEATPPEECNSTKETPLTWNQQGIAGAPGAPGSHAASAVIGRVDGAFIFGTAFAAPSGTSIWSLDEFRVTHLSPNSTVVMRDLRISAVSLSATPQVTFTLRDDGVDTPVSCTILPPGPGPFSCNSGLSSHTVAPGSELSLKIVSSEGSVELIRFGWRATTP